MHFFALTPKISKSAIILFSSFGKFFKQFEAAASVIFQLKMPAVAETKKTAKRVEQQYINGGSAERFLRKVWRAHRKR